MSNNIEQTLDRILLSAAGASNHSNGTGATTTAAVADPDDNAATTNTTTSSSTFLQDAPDFVYSATWQGSKLGYVFRTSDKGTGYYKDRLLETPMLQSNEEKHTIKSSSSGGRKKVTIAEDNNEIKILLEKLEQNVQHRGNVVVVELSAKGIRGAAKSLQNIYQKNLKQRSSFADEPEKYMNSELSLYEQLTGLQAVGADPSLYQHVESSELMTTLIQLLAHENSDVCASVVSLFLEWIDPSLIEDDPDVRPILKRFAKLVLEAWESVVYNLFRFQQDEANADDEIENNEEAQDSSNLKGIENTLSLMENLMELDTLTAAEGGLLGDTNRDDDNSSNNNNITNLSAAGWMTKESKIVSWLFIQIESDDVSPTIQARCIELLAFLSQNVDVFEALPNWSSLPPIKNNTSDSNSKKKQKTSVINGIEDLIQIVGLYRKKQPSNDIEIEMLENSCITLSSCISFSISNMSAFLESQGVQLAVRCLKERVMAGGVCLKLLDSFGDDAVYKRGAEEIVLAGGLKYIFPLLLGSRIPKPAGQTTTKKEKREWINMIKEQTIRVFYALTLQLDETSPDEAKARFLAKFVEDDMKHCDRLVELLLEFDERARKAEYAFYRTDVEETFTDDEVTLAAFDAKLKGGGDIYHRIAAVTAFVCANSKRCHERVLSQLSMQQSGISLIKSALLEFGSSLKSGGRQKHHIEALMDSI